MSGAVAVILAMTAPLAAAVAADSHAGHHSAQSEPVLNHGEKWQTDAPLRKGMAEIRNLMGKSLLKIHAGRLDRAEYAKLSDGISAQVDYLTANCKLAPEADAQLHLVLAQIIDGAAAMKTDHPQDGAAQVVDGLGVYGRLFDHPGWQPLAH